MSGVTQPPTLPEFVLARIDQEESAWKLDLKRGWLLARCLARCEADRRIIQLHSCRDPDRPDPYCPTCDDTTPPAETLYPCTTLRLLALPYVDHPDYDERWRP